jgi:hypothetical protein
MESIKSFTHNNKTIALLNYNTIKQYNIITPYEQRIMDKSKVANILDYQVAHHKTRGYFNFLGVINLHYCKENQNFYIIDGQHRFNAIKELGERNYNIDFVCEIITINTLSEIKENYNLINKNTPLPELNENIDMNIHTQIFSYFEERYPDIWKFSSKRTKRPYIIKNDFQGAIGFLMEKMPNHTCQQIINLIDGVNKKIAGWTRERFKFATNINTKTLSNLDKTLEICKTTGMYLGLYNHLNEEFHYHWVYDMIKYELGYELAMSKHKRKKKAIPKKIKMEIWAKYIGNQHGESECWCCHDTLITQLHFVAGHFKAEAKGGGVTVDNLRPICSGCNSSMGTKDMDEYMREHYIDV